MIIMISCSILQPCCPCTPCIFYSHHPHLLPRVNFLHLIIAQRCYYLRTLQYCFLMPLQSPAWLLHCQSIPLPLTTWRLWRFLLLQELWRVSFHSPQLRSHDRQRTFLGQAWERKSRFRQCLAAQDAPWITGCFHQRRRRSRLVAWGGEKFWRLSICPFSLKSSPYSSPLSSLGIYED